MKKILAVVLVLVMSINSFAAIVSDNDGSAFVTKAEFESLKKDFNQQIDNYNESIDGKIDGAIAAYLAGLRLASTVQLELDSKCNYSFPLYYDPNNYWDNYTITNGYKLFLPEFHKTKYLVTTHGFIRPQSTGDQIVWASGNKTTGVFSTSATSLTMDSNYRNQVITYVEYKYDYKGKDGLLNQVTRLSSTRKINGTNYNVYSLDDEGIGRFIHSYLADCETNGGNGNMFINSGVYSTGSAGLVGVNKSQLTITGSGASIRLSVKDPTGTFTKTQLTKTSCTGAGAGWGNQTDITSKFPVNTQLTANKISEYIYGTAGDNTKETKTYWDKKPLSEASTYSKPSSRTLIYSRDMFMPANTDSNYSLTADLQKNDDTKFTIAGGGSSTLKGMVAWSETSKTFYNKPQISVIAVAPLKRYIWHSTTKYAPSTSDVFSYLPATLVTYKDSNDKTHYMDEGMFLGTINGNGDVCFNVSFKRDYGTGTKLVLHVSKKPFSYDSKTSDNIEYYIGNTKSSEQEVEYGKSYTIRVPDISKNDELYFEWVPVSSEDLSALASFSNFALITTS